MIRKIKTTEYLKGYDAMGDDERTAWLKRVGEWLTGDGKRLLEITDRPMAKSQNIMLLAARWGKDDCQAFYEGTLLLSALAGMTDTWLPTQLFARPAYRAVRQIVELLGNPDGIKGCNLGRKGCNLRGKGCNLRGKGCNPRGATATDNTPEDTDVETLDVVETAGGPALVQGRKTVIEEEKERIIEKHAEGDASLVPVRPKHIDQYVHLLPQKTQERAAQVKGLLTELDEAREKARLLMEAGEHSDKIELWARKASRLDGAVKSIYRELDSEWDKLVKQGRVGVDDLGNAYVRPLSQLPETEDDGGAPENAELTSEQKHRRRELRKFLTDTRRGNGNTREDHILKWQEAWKEYLTLEPKDKALADQKILEAMKHYEISV